MKEVVEQIPGVNYEFTQPIEMRFNELLEGVREDIAIKLYGEDINILASKAEDVAKIITGTPGIGDMRVEATKGLPQMTVTYNRYKLAQYGLNISQLNMILESSFAGGKAGVIFEGEKRFDLVVRLNEENRQSIENLKNLYINVPNGAQIPLKEVANISYQPGPMQISRDNTNRRIYVGVNVRGRDVKSLVNEIQQKLDKQLELPAGYYIRYGGAFENLERANKRLQIVVPIALGLIFILIFFALKSFRQSLMIYIAIPLAAIGGVYSLWLRGMPFSISAGIGFIVLFGVAVLNGLVLISGWNELKEEGVTDLNQRIRLGAKRRIRPILLTALTDVLGFLPMAISTSAGAEVQQPLATVVIGGMITATFLTLFVMPVLYQWVESRQLRFNVPKTIVPIVIFGLVFIFTTNRVFAQNSDPTQVTSLKQAIELALENNGDIKVSKGNIHLLEETKKGSFNPGNTDISFQYGQYNSFENDLAFEINQNIEFPTLYSRQKQLANEQILGAEKLLQIEESKLKRDVRKAWYQLAYLEERYNLLMFQDSLFQRFLFAAKIRYETEESSFLEKTAAETKVMEILNELQLLRSDIEISQDQLRILLNDKGVLVFMPEKLNERVPLYKIDSSFIQNNPTLDYLKQQIEIAEAKKAIQSAKLLPGFSLGYFNQSLIGTTDSNGNLTSSEDRFDGIQAGISIPLFFGSAKSKVKTAAIEKEISQVRADYASNVLSAKYNQHIQELVKLKGSLYYYKEKAIPQSDLIFENAQESFENGAINYVEYFQSLNQGLQIQFNFLNTINRYNQVIINLEYLVGE